MCQKLYILQIVEKQISIYMELLTVLIFLKTILRFSNKNENWAYNSCLHSQLVKIKILSFLKLFLSSCWLVVYQNFCFIFFVSFQWQIFLSEHYIYELDFTQVKVFVIPYPCKYLVIKLH